MVALGRSKVLGKAGFLLSQQPEESEVTPCTKLRLPRLCAGHLSCLSSTEGCSTAEFWQWILPSSPHRNRSVCLASSVLAETGDVGFLFF